MPYVTARQCRERLCENGGLLLIEADDRKVGDLHAALISLTVVVQARFLYHIRVIIVLLLITQ